MAPTITYVTVFNGALHALRLSWNSFAFFHPKQALFWCYNNGDKTAARDYANAQADLVIHSEYNDGHGPGLNTLCRQVKTRYTLVCDMDIEFLRPTAHRMILELQSEPDALCVAYPSHRDECVPVVHFGWHLMGQKRINPCCALFDTQKLNQILPYFGFEVFWSSLNFYDVGGVLYNVARAAGMKVLEPEWVRDSVRHYGSMGALLVGAFPVGSSDHTRTTNNYKLIEERSKLYPDPKPFLVEPDPKQITV